MRGENFGARGAVLPRTVVMVLAACLLAAGAQALMVPQDQSSLAGSADGIVLGTVTSVESRWTPDRNLETTAQIALDSAVKGTFAGRAVAVTVQGGTADGVMQVVEDEPVLAPGERGFYLLERRASGFKLHGARQGVIPVVDDTVWVADGHGAPRAVSAPAYGARLAALAEGREAPAPEEASVVTAAAGPVIASVSPTSASAGTGTTVTITGTDFGSKASRQSAADVGFVYRCTSPTSCVPVYATGKPYYGDNANDILSWTDTRIVVRVPTARMSDGYAGSAGSGMVWVVTDAGATSAASPFAVTFGYGRIRWANAPTFVVNNNCPGVASASTAVANAAATWNAAVSGSSFRFVDGGTTASTAIGNDGVNRICWRPSSDFSSGTLAVTSWWYTVSTSTLIECDVKFNSGFAWTTGTASGSAHNVEAIMLHEFGHWLNLRDLYGYYDGYPSDSGKVMFGYSGAGFGNLNRRALSGADTAGARYIYGGGTATPTPTPTATPTPKPTATATPTTPVPQAPYPSAHVLPAQVEAEHFDAGGEGVAYHDSEAANLGNDGTRSGEGVDIETDGGVTDACYVRAGEYLKYSVETTTGGSFDLALRAANPDAATKTARVYLDGARTPDVAIAPTGGWTNYGSSVTTVFVPSGRHVVTLAFEGIDRINLDWLRFTRSAATLPTTVPTTAAVAAIPGGAGVPTDPDTDGLYEDVNGNGRGDLADVVLLFNQLTWIGANEPPAAFDFNANGRIDFDDVVSLFTAL
ncbi:MAG: carbohydrate-binding protein [Methanospirillum sp.]